MKKLTLWLIRIFANDRAFRINVCKELHYNAQNYYGEQTSIGRYYEACDEFYEAAPQFTKKQADNWIESLEAENEQLKERFREREHALTSSIDSLIFERDNLRKFM